MSDQKAIREKIIDTIRAVEPTLGNVPISDTASLVDLNMDSLRLVELGVLLEENFGREVRFDEWLEQERARGADAYLLKSLITFISEAASI